MGRLLKTLLLSMTLAVILGGTAFASEFQPKEPKSGNSKQVQQWLGLVGLEPDSEGLARDLLQVMEGVGYPVNPTTSFVISARNGITFGFSF